MTNWSPYILEIGMGIDHSGEDVTKAAKKAVQDAISRTSMIGLRPLIDGRGLDALNEVLMVDVTIATPHPEKVDRKAVLDTLPVGKRQLTVVSGGLQFPAPENRDLQNLNSIVIANALLVVMVDAEKTSIPKQS